MCTEKRYIKTKAYDPVVSLHQLHLSVPCGKCDECRSALQSEWQTRLLYHTHDTYKNGGVGVFLTFTYAPNKLHYFPVPELSDVPCFDRSEVIEFLHALKHRVQKHYGYDMYTYFLVSEYGKTTKRPHLHMAAYLKNGLDPTWFAETCRALWSDKGFMFPKYDHKRKMYVDNYNCPSDILFKSEYGSARYVSKYITKDISFYSIPALSDYIARCGASKISNCLPKHWQSNGIGLSQIEFIRDMRDAIKNGVINPYEVDKKLPLSQYALKRLMYTQVPNGRVSERTGQKLYSRVFTERGKEFASLLFSEDIRTHVAKFEEYDKLHHFQFPREWHLICALWQRVLRGMSLTNLDEMYVGCSREDALKRFFNYGRCYQLWYQRHDFFQQQTYRKVFVEFESDWHYEQACADLEWCHGEMYYAGRCFDKFLRDVDSYVTNTERFFASEHSKMLAERKLKYIATQQFKYDYFAKYDKSLC